MQEFKISELEKEVKEGEKRDAVDSADSRAAQRDLRRLQVLLGFCRNHFFQCCGSEIFYPGSKKHQQKRDLAELRWDLA